MCTYPLTQPKQLINAAKDPSVNVALKSLNVCAEKCGIFKCWKRIRCQLFSLWREFYLFIYSILVLISVKNKFSLHPLYCKNTWKKKKKRCRAITFCWYRCLTAELGPLGLEKLKEMPKKNKEKHSWRFVGNTWQATDLHLLKKKKGSKFTPRQVDK